MRLVVLGLGAALAFPGVASAAWVKAETDRFIVYGEGRGSVVRDYALRLTTFDAILRFFHPTAQRPPTQKVEVYLATRPGQMRGVAPGLPNDIQGFYAARPDGVIAIVGGAGQALGGDDVLFHEYAHHFMLENFPAAYPAWFVEGWAEYFMTAEVTPKTVKVGGYNLNRVYWLFSSSWLPMEDVLSKRLGEVRKDRRYMYYPQAWLFMHYMRSDTTRAAQLDQAIREIANGAEPVAAMEKATGTSAAALTAVLRKYQKLRVYNVPNPLKEPPAITVSALPDSADDMLLPGVRMALSQGVEPDEAFLSDVRRRAAKHPGDRMSDLVLARAEFTYGDVAAGEAIVNRWLATDPKDPQVLRLAGVGQLLAGDRDLDQRTKRYQAGRVFLIKAYQIDPDDYRTLYYYVASRTVEPAYPNDNDVTALLTARGMAPSVETISFAAGTALLGKDRKKEAAVILRPLANNPHGGRNAAIARALIEGKSIPEAQAEAERIEREGNDDSPPPQPASGPPAAPSKGDESAPVSP